MALFGLGKKKHTYATQKSKVTLDNATIDDAIDKVLLGYNLSNGVSLAAFVNGLERQADVVNIGLEIPQNLQTDVKQLHLNLSKQLAKHGINEVNIRLLTSKVATSATKAAGMPKTVNAAVNTNAPHTQANKKPPSQAELPPHPRIKHIVVVASGKGGVGKSTTTVNLALALQQLGNKVGVLDADIYGPSIPTMLGVAGQTPQLENEQFVPIEAHGMPVLSIGNLTGDDNTPIVWRGIKATGALMQLFGQTNWPNLDYLLIDMPPGTGDIQLTLAQRIPITAAIVVTTPQHIALLDAQKGIEMFRKVNIPVLGIVENMSLHTCSSCGHTEAIFGAGGGDKLSDTYQVPLLGQLPLNAQIREHTDNGTPSVVAKDDCASFYVAIAQKIQNNIGHYAKVSGENRIF